MKDTIKTYLIALNQIEKVGDRKITKLIDHYSTIENIFEDDEENIKDVIIKKFKSNVGNFSKNEILDKATSILEKSKKQDIEIITLFDKEYPFNLKQIENPPYIIYSKGNIKHLKRNSIAIVGTRNPDEKSRKYAFDMASKFSALNISVVSGMAKGIDKEAHAGAISALGNTVAVLGNGIDIVYPSENLKIYEKTIEKGVVISEFSIGRRPDRQNFPRRNRIISGLSYGTIMVEASVKSGALITVDYALNQGREVYIAPYDEKLSSFFGNHKLYKDGAKIAYDISDILIDLDEILSYDEQYIKMKSRYFEGGIIKNEKREEKDKNRIISKNKYKPNDNIKLKPLKNETESLSEEEGLIYKIICSAKKIHIDDIIEKSNMKVQIATMILMRLELNGFIKQLTGKYYILER